MNLTEAYTAMQNACGIAVGDTVRVLRKAETHEMGWANSWVRAQDALVGTEFVVDYISKSGISSSRYGLGFPFFVLEVVHKNATIQLNSRYTATVRDNLVVVGCQSFSFDAVKELYAAVIAHEKRR